MVELLPMAKSLVMTGCGRGLYIPLIIVCRLSLVINLNLLQNVKSVTKMLIVFMIALSHLATH